VKAFVVLEVTFKGQSRSSAMSPFVRSPGLNLQKSLQKVYCHPSRATV